MSAATANLELQQAAVRQHCKLLRMPTVSTQFATMAEQAIRARQTHIGYLEALLAAELEERAKNTVERRIREAHLPKVKTLEEFDFAEAPKVSAAQIRELAEGGYNRTGRADSVDWGLRNREDAPVKRIVRCRVPAEASRSIYDGGGVGE